MPTPDPITAALAVAGEARRRILALVRALPAGRRYELVPLVRRELVRVEPLFALTLRDGQVLAWLEAARDQVKGLKPAAGVGLYGGGKVSTRFAPSWRPADEPPEPPEEGYFPDDPDDPERPVAFPQVERAARYLHTRLDYTPEEFAALDDDARRVGFTVAKAATLDAAEKVRQAVAADVREGGTLKQFRAAVADALGESVLSKPQVEALYRTHVARAYSAGQQDVLDHPLVADEFPYLLYSATHDGRVRPEHLAMEHLGLDGTAVYRADDPVWAKFYPPWSWQCRCIVIPLGVADAAKHGVREAIRWVQTGQPPASPEWVRPLPFDLPKGWVPTGRRLAAVL